MTLNSLMTVIFSFLTEFNNHGANYRYIGLLSANRNVAERI